MEELLNNFLILAKGIFLMKISISPEWNNLLFKALVDLAWL